ncbi:peptidase E [Gemmatimonadetes bacterium T265]|nr:peptidase E [Gemmatimonadetes bacterium T265]
MPPVDPALRAARRLLLLSNSRDPAGRYLVHARDALAAHLAGVREVAFVPYAGVTVGWDAYAARAAGAFAPLGITLRGVHADADPAAVLAGAGAVAVGGGNTFHLLAELRRRGLVAALRARAAAGAPYVGWSAGAVVACPTIRTTNDMPIVEPPGGLDALGLFGAQVNAHFTDAHPPGFQGETRRERLAEFLAANPRSAVVGLPEGSWLAVAGARAAVGGAHAALVFRAGRDAEAVPPGGDLATAEDDA